jgi:hypothetical protein
VFATVAKRLAVIVEALVVAVPAVGLDWERVVGVGSAFVVAVDL